MRKFISFIVCTFFISCDLDEEAPDEPTNVRGYFTMSESNPRIRILWNSPLNNDIKEYHIFKSSDNGFTFDSLDLVLVSNTFYEDTSIIWMKNFGYKIRAKDYSTNIGEFSDSIYINCFKPGGNWVLSDYDSIKLCLDPKTNQTQETLQLDYYGGFLNDTLKLMDFPSIQIDTLTWSSNGWMYLTIMTLEMSSDSSNYDTIVFSNTIAPEYYFINLENPEEGKIIFNSEQFDDIDLYHSLKGCDGVDLFP